MIVFLLTSGQNYQQSSYCKTNPTSSGVQLECSMTETPSWAHWFVASVPRFSSHGVTGACFVFLLPMKKSPAGIQEVSTQTPRSATRHWNNVNLQQKYAKIIIKDLFRVNKHSGRRALEDRWDILFRLTRCWKKLPLFQSGLHLFPPPPHPLPSRWKTQTWDQFTVALSSYSDHQLFEATQHDIITTAVCLIGRQLLLILGKYSYSCSCRLPLTCLCEIQSCTSCLEKLSENFLFIL